MLLFLMRFHANDFFFTAWGALTKSSSFYLLSHTNTLASFGGWKKKEDTHQRIPTVTCMKLLKWQPPIPVHCKKKRKSRKNIICFAVRNGVYVVYMNFALIVFAHRHANSEICDYEIQQYEPQPNFFPSVFLRGWIRRVLWRHLQIE